MTLTEIIARVQVAAGPDRRLDFDLWSVITNPSGWPALSETEENRTIWFDTWKDRGGFPNYTSSLDAALSLVPEGYDWIVANVNGHYGGTPYACVGSEQSHYAATPVLTLVLAALRARAAA